MVSSREENIRTSGKEQTKGRKRRDGEGQEERNKVLARGGFTSDSMILRRLRGKERKREGQEGELAGVRVRALLLSCRRSKRYTIAFCRVWWCGPLSMQIVSLSRLCRIIDRDPLLFSKGNNIAHLLCQVSPT